MRLDLPREQDRPRAVNNNTFPPLEPSEVEQRRESLAARASEDRGPAEHVRRSPRQSISQTNSVTVRREVSREPPDEQDRDRRPRRNNLPQQMVGLALRDEERKLLAEVGRFRVVATRDLAETVYGGRDSRIQRDLAFLRQKGLVDVDAVNARRDGRGGRAERIEVVTLTKAGQSFVRLTGGLAQDQKLYAGLVKPREVEHDSQIYRAYRKEAERIEGNGGTNLRVKLDFELKSDVQKAIYAERKADPQRDMNEIREKVAGDFDLPFVNAGIQIPDARIVYDIDPKPDEDIGQGSHTGHEDIEVLTAAYSPGHLRAKAQAGFRNYASSSDRASVTAKIERDHNLIEDILEL